ncbi:hypothetical protein KIPB_006334, partial [Kipferlia bialata]|eukprot:g6334.t1
MPLVFLGHTSKDVVVVGTEESTEIIP